MKAATMGLVTSLAKPHRANKEVTRIKGHKIPYGITRAGRVELSTFEEGFSAIGKHLSNHSNDKIQDNIKPLLPGVKSFFLSAGGSFGHPKIFAYFSKLGIDKKDRMWYNNEIMQINRKNTGWWWSAG